MVSKIKFLQKGLDYTLKITGEMSLLFKFILIYSVSQK